MGRVTRIPRGEAPDPAERVRRLRALAWLLDSSIPLPGGYRIGLDSLIGLVPGIGDAIAALLATYILAEARALGVPRSVLLRMIGNVLIDTAVGAVPVAGDLFDAAFKANMRNLELLERYQFDPLRARRSSRWFVAGFTALVALLILAVVAIPVLLILALVSLA